MGRHIALALQAFIELQSFIDETSEQELNLSNAPILFHLQHDPEMLAYIQNCENDISNLNLSQVSTNTSPLDNAPNYLPCWVHYPKEIHTSNNTVPALVLTGFLISNYIIILQIYTAVRKSGIGIQKTQELCRDHASETFHLLSDLPDGDAKSALEKIVNHLS